MSPLEPDFPGPATRPVQTANMRETVEQSSHRIELDLQAQPDDTTCGPTCLQSVYRYLGDEVSLGEVIRQVPKLKGGGTLGVLLGRAALKRGYKVTIYSYNLQIFDPTWSELPAEGLRDKLAAQARAKRSAKLKQASKAYGSFLKMGGQIKFEVLSGALIRRLLNRNLPVIAGLSSTYLYGCAREFGPNDDSDDIRGNPAGHFVVLCGYDRKEREVVVADPLHTNPHSPTRKYSIGIDRVISSILLGVLTYDANLMIIEKVDESANEESHA
jgi:hypothetical protein